MVRPRLASPLPCFVVQPNVICGCRVCLDFGEFYRVLPDHYTLGYYVNGDDHIPCSWELQGSSDLVRWTALHRQMDSSSLIPKPHVASWPIAPPGSIAQMDEDESNFVHAQAKARRNVQPSPIVVSPLRHVVLHPQRSFGAYLVLRRMPLDRTRVRTVTSESSKRAQLRVVAFSWSFRVSNFTASCSLSPLPVMRA